MDSHQRGQNGRFLTSGDGGGGHSLMSVVVFSLLAMMSVLSSRTLAEPCSAPIALDDKWRHVSNVDDVSTDHCDKDLLSVDKWYTFLIDGQPASVPTSCIKNGLCGAQIALHVRLSGQALPAKVGDTITAHLCGLGDTDGKQDCCAHRSEVKIARCENDALVYQFSSPLAGCPAAVCTLRRGEFVPPEARPKVDEDLPDLPVLEDDEPMDSPAEEVTLELSDPNGINSTMAASNVTTVGPQVSLAGASVHDSTGGPNTNDTVVDDEDMGDKGIRTNTTMIPQLLRESTPSLNTTSSQDASDSNNTTEIVDDDDANSDQNVTLTQPVPTASSNGSTPETTAVTVLPSDSDSNISHTDVGSSNSTGTPSESSQTDGMSSLNPSLTDSTTVTAVHDEKTTTASSESSGLDTSAMPGHAPILAGKQTQISTTSTTPYASTGIKLTTSSTSSSTTSSTSPMVPQLSSASTLAQPTRLSSSSTLLSSSPTPNATTSSTERPRVPSFTIDDVIMIEMTRLVFEGIYQDTEFANRVYSLLFSFLLHAKEQKAREGSDWTYDMSSYMTPITHGNTTYLDFRIRHTAQTEISHLFKELHLRKFIAQNSNLTLLTVCRPSENCQEGDFDEEPLQSTFERNAPVFITVIVLCTVCVAVMVAGLLCTRCRRRGTWEAGEEVESKALSDNRHYFNAKQSPFTDAQIMKDEAVDDTSFNGSAEDGDAKNAENDNTWVIPLDDAIDRNKVVVAKATENTRL